MKNTFLTLLLLTTLFGQGQQLNTSSFFELHSVLHNPATVGSRQKATMGASFKKQWSSMPGSPQTSFVFGQAYLPDAKLGLGGYLYHDVTGPTARTGLQTAYAYHIPVNEESRMSFGLEARVQQLSFDRAKLQGSLGSLDPVVTASGTRLKADAGFGMAYTSPRLHVGGAVSQLVQSKYNLYEMIGTTEQQSRLHRHYYLHGAYTFLPDEATRITPHTLLIYLPNAPLDVQSGVRVTHNNQLWYGLGWRKQQGWMLAAGLMLKQRFAIGYAFDFYNSPLSVYEKGSSGHELLLHYTWH